MAYNLDIFEKVIFHIPSTKKTATLITSLGTLYSVAFYIMLGMFTRHSLEPNMIPLLAFFLFIAPCFVSGELLHRFLPDYPRKWGYFLMLSTQLIIFIYTAILSGANNFVNAWNIFWLGLITVFLANMIVLILSVGMEHLSKIGMLSAVQPMMILGGFHYFLGRLLNVTAIEYLSNLGVLLFAGLMLVVVILVQEYLMGSNISNITASSLAAGILQKEQAALDVGYLSRPDVQTLAVENQSGRATIAAPWVHPGPLEGFGGGSLSEKIIKHLNEDGTGFFFHIPSTHQDDPADPNDCDKIIDALAEPELGGKASKLISRQYEGIEFHGRKIGEQKIVFMETDRYDDFEKWIFRDIIDLDNVLLVDRHSHTKHKDRDTLFYGTVDAERFREHLLEFLRELEELEMHDYYAGYSSKTNDKSAFTLVEEVGGQRTLILAVDENGPSQNVLSLKEEMQGYFDETLVVTTDTHRSIHELALEKEIPREELLELVEKAEENVSAATIGVTNSLAEEIKILQKDYYSLMYSLNIIVRLFVLALVVLYLGLIIWVF